MSEFSPFARLLSHGKLVLCVGVFAVFGAGQALAGIETSRDFPLEEAGRSSESSADKVLAMYRKDVGIPAEPTKTSVKPSVRRAAVVTENK